MKGYHLIGLASLILLSYTGVNAQNGTDRESPLRQPTRPGNEQPNRRSFSPSPRVSASTTTRITQNQNRLNYTMNGGELLVSGNFNEIVVRGKCSKLSLTGNSNIVYVESVSDISTSGHRNEVIWRTGNPAVNNTGSGNNIVSREYPLR